MLFAFFVSCGKRENECGGKVLYHALFVHARITFSILLILLHIIRNFALGQKQKINKSKNEKSKLVKERERERKQR